MEGYEELREDGSWQGMIDLMHVSALPLCLFGFMYLYDLSAHFTAKRSMFLLRPWIRCRSRHVSDVKCLTT